MNDKKDILAVWDSMNRHRDMMTSCIEHRGTRRGILVASDEWARAYQRSEEDYRECSNTVFEFIKAHLQEDQDE